MRIIVITRGMYRKVNEKCKILIYVTLEQFPQINVAGPSKFLSFT